MSNRISEQPFCQTWVSGSKEKNLVVMPSHINVYNGSHERCDMLIGACSCGAWHRIEDWEGKIENVESFFPYCR